MSTSPTISPAQQDETSSRAGRNLPAAIAMGALLVCAIVLTLWQWNWGFVLMTAAALAAGVFEVNRALKRLDMHAALTPILVGTIAIVVGSYYNGHEPYSFMPFTHMPSQTCALVTIGFTAMAALIWRMPKGPKGYVKDAAASLFIVGYVGVLGSFVTLMIAGHNGAARVLVFILSVAASDTGGYLFGVLFGKHKMSPMISPKKTWEGLAGSIFTSCLAASLTMVWCLGTPWWMGIPFGIVCTLAGTGGDLVESLIKRDVGIKDMSGFLPGHGGFMDRLDSLLVAAPAAWLVLYLLVPGG